MQATIPDLKRSVRMPLIWGEQSSAARHGATCRRHLTIL